MKMNDIKNFWRWMKLKGYAYEHKYKGLFDKNKTFSAPILKNGQSEIKPTKQMLIGYMLEYLKKSKIVFNINTLDFEIEELYDLLKKQIESEV